MRVGESRLNSTVHMHFTAPAEGVNDVAPTHFPFLIYVCTALLYYHFS